MKTFIEDKNKIRKIEVKIETRQPADLNDLRKFIRQRAKAILLVGETARYEI